MALPAINTNAPAAAPQAASNAAPAANLDAIFAALVAQLAPNENGMPANDADAAPAPKNPSQKISRTDPATILAALGMPNAQTQIVPVKPADAAVADATKGAKAPKQVNMDMLRALVAKASGQPATKPGTPQLPVTAKDARDDAKPGSKQTTQAKTADPAIVAAAAHNTVKPAQPAQTTEAQALAVRFDAKADSHGTQSDGGNSKNQDQRGNTPNAPQATQNVQPDAPIATQTAQPAHAPANVTAANAIAQPTQANAPVAANAHIALQNHQPSAQPDLGAIAVTIATKSREGSKQFDIRLDPPEMGRIDVRLSLDDNGKAQAHLSADKPQTLELLQRDSRNLERALKDAGVDLSNNGLNFSLKGEQRQADGGARTPSRNRQLTIHAVAATSTAPINSFASNSATLDIRV